MPTRLKRFLCFCALVLGMYLPLLLLGKLFAGGPAETSDNLKAPLRTEIYTLSPQAYSAMPSISDTDWLPTHNIPKPEGADIFT